MAMLLPWHSGTAASLSHGGAEAVCPAKLKIFTIWRFTENICRAPDYTLYHHNDLIRERLTAEEVEKLVPQNRGLPLTQTLTEKV